MVEAPEFNVNDIYDFELIVSMKYKFGCSRATIYRAIKKANLPIYCLHGKAYQTLLYGFDLWKLACTPCFKKFLRRNGYVIPGKWKAWHIQREYKDSDVITLFNEGYFAPLTLQEVIAAVQSGLIPAKEDLSLPTFFIARLKKLMVVPLPRKA